MKGTVVGHLRRKLGVDPLSKQAASADPKVGNLNGTVAKLAAAAKRIEATLAKSRKSQDRQIARVKDIRQTVGRLHEQVLKLGREVDSLTKTVNAREGHFASASLTAEEQLEWAKDTGQMIGRLPGVIAGLLADLAAGQPSGPPTGFAAPGGLGADFEREILDAISGTDPIFVGPWLSEVGFEILYWIPFLNWLVEAYRVDKSRLIAISRGGVGEWYRSVAESYIEILDVFSADDLRGAAEARQAVQDGSLKQFASFAFDERILAAARTKVGLANAKVLHPSLMYRSFNPYWAGVRTNAFVKSRLRFAPFHPTDHPVLKSLPEEFAAARFYGGSGFPLSRENVARVDVLIRRLASSLPVVMLNHGFRIDDHEEFDFSEIPNVTYLTKDMHPADNLALQSAVISRARCFIGTYGGLAYLPIALGTPSIGVISRDHRRLSVHGNIAYYMADALGGSLTLLRIETLAHLGLESRHGQAVVG